MGTTILLVDDVQMFLEIQQEFLADSAVEIFTARNGVEALEQIKSNRPDLVFMDLHMPKMDGAACCRAIKADVALLNIPVVMITTMGNAEDQELCFAAGCDYFLTKPLDRDKYLEVARRYLPSINRRQKRLTINIAGSFRVDETTLPCTIHDLSIDGAFVATDYFGIPNRVIHISFALPDGSTIDCRSMIAWSNRIVSDIPRGFGVKFALLSKDELAALKHFLEAAA